MTGICIVGGTTEARARAQAIMGRLHGTGAAPDVLAVNGEAAIGTANGGLYNGNDGLTVAVDGEIFNDHGPLAEPAAEIARHYRDGELERISTLNGSFVAIIADAPRARVVLAADRLGSRGLFVWSDGPYFAAASRLHALLGDDRVPSKLSARGLLELLAYQRTVGDHTQYAAIRSLPAAAIWTLGGGGIDMAHGPRLAWRPPQYGKRETAERLAAAMANAAARRTADTKRHGLLLSGGLDSRWVLAAALAAGRTIPCITAAPFENREVAIARRVAERAGQTFHFLPNPPDRLASHLDDAVRASDGLFAAPVNLFGLLGTLAEDHDVLLSGHGLDYTFRGYYLPCRMIRPGNSVMRLPRLRRIKDGDPATVATSLRVGIDPAAARRTLAQAHRDGWLERRVAAMETVRDHADIDNPYDAWDAFILHALGRHYAYSDFVAMQSAVRHRALTFDNEVFDLYLQMPPKWRAEGKVAHRAMCLLGGKLMALPDANTGFSARHGFASQAALSLARGALGRARLVKRPPSPVAAAGQGSWADSSELLRLDPLYVKRLGHLHRSEALLDTGLFDSAGLKAVVAEHLGRRGNHKKLLMQLLSIESWLRQHPYSGIDARN